MANNEIVVIGKRSSFTIDAGEPLVNTAVVDLSSIVIPSINDGPCQIKREKKADENEAKKGSPLAADIRELTQMIRAETDCNALQQKVKTALNGLKEDIKSATDEVKKKLDEILPITKLPLNPFKIPKWLKKFAIGRIFPDLEATIDMIKKVVEVITALTALIKTVQEVLPRLEACAISTKDMIESEIKNEIDKALKDIKNDIEEAIAEAICKGINAAGISADDIDDILSGVSTVTNLIDSVDKFKEEINGVLGSSLTRIGENQANIQDITGIPPAIDTSSLDAFLVSVDSPAYTQYKQDVQAVLDLPEPVNTELPVITGDPFTGSTLECSNGVWTANGVVTNFTLGFQWMRQGQEIFGANTYQYIPSMDDVDYPVYCKVTAENQTNIEEVFTANTSPIQFVLASGNEPVITGTAQNGQTLQCSEGTWPFTPTQVTYEWIRVVIPGSNVRVQSSSSNNEYYVKTADIGSQIKCKVTAFAYRYVVSSDSNVTDTVTV